MPRKKLPSATFETGILIRRKIADWTRLTRFKLVNHWHVIGRLEDGTPFYLAYQDGVTHWTCEADLGDSLRKKILGMLREQLRRQSDAIPAYITLHDFTEKESIESVDLKHAAILKAFFKDTWRAAYLNDRDEDYVTLTVPFVEKDAAKALGAKWDGAVKAWKVKKQPDMSAFSRWLPPVG
jgi:hypothetical protein